MQVFFKIKYQFSSKSKRQISYFKMNILQKKKNKNKTATISYYETLKYIQHKIIQQLTCYKIQPTNQPINQPIA